MHIAYKVTFLWLPLRFPRCINIYFSVLYRSLDMQVIAQSPVCKVQEVLWTEKKI